ncbi:helix-turn-helix domain-containing protein [Thermomonospora umbrina]|uniref:Helix-turn-helix protein n=1 Tax=Thermomonospora umbrina TaxID=111806 RepID=A0A3D9SPL0_9ACTN|nr:helix-turn-helix transcriptional regulator [Thermomonospora umbrina]REE97848.1 helix-turn-helix protein [Thermomonospora umbrina]
MMARPLVPERSLWHLIAVEVRRQRELHQLSGSHLANLLGCDRSTVSRIENGLRRLSPDNAAQLDELWRTGGLFTRLVRFAAAADDGNWFTGLTQYEEQATHHRMWEALLIPGIFQTPDYARAALTVGMVDDVEAAFNLRMARQTAVFDRPRVANISVLLNWVALAQPVGDAETMRGQLARLLELSELPNVSVRIVEKEANVHLGLDGSFTLLTVDDHDIAFADAPERGRLMIDPPDVQRFAVRYERISNIATPIGPSRALIERAMETYQ